MRPKLNAGYARRIISPQKGIYLIGYGDRLWGNQGTHDDLTATALALDDGFTKVVIIACDLLAINEITLSRVENEVNTNIIVCCSHTHSGPIVYADKKSSKKNKKYVEFLIVQPTEVINEALKNLGPARLFWGAAEADISVNRRERMPDGSIQIGVNPEGIIDRSIGILQIKMLDGEPLANLVNFACHNVVLGPKNLLVSADWAGAMRRVIEHETGVPCLFIQGATADLNPDHEWGDDDFSATEDLGNRVAKAVIAGLSDLRSISIGDINFTKSVFWLPLEVEVRTQNPPTSYKSKLTDLINLPKFLVDPILQWRYPWKTRIENKNGFWSVPMEVVLFKVGDFVWIGFGAEVFTEIGITLKGSSQSQYSFFSSLTNGCIGYLPTMDEHRLGGYEVDIAPYAYRLPGRLQANSSEIVIEEMNRLLNPEQY
jgi:hypothetical protein